MTENNDIEIEENANGEGADRIIYSYSMLESFRKCRYSFYRHYVMKERPPLQGTEAFLGTNTHEAIQNIYRQKKLRGATLTKEDALNFYDMNWDAACAVMREKGIKIISITGPNGMKRQTESGAETLTESKRRGRAMVEVYYDTHFPFSDVRDIKIERVFIFDLNGRKIKCKIDMLGYNGHIKLFEFKTGRRASTDAWKKQVSIYIMAVKKYAGEAANIEAVVYHLANNDRYDMTHLNAPKNLEDVQMALMADILDIELLTQNWTLKDMAKYRADPTNPHLCPWCSFYSDCPSWAHMFNGRQVRV